MKCCRCFFADRDSRTQEDEDWLMVFLVSYVFLLRLPSETLPMRTCTNTRDDLKEGHSKSEVSFDGTTLTLRLRTRKNESAPTMMTRTCWCKDCPLLCPIHVFAAWAFRPKPRGVLFEGITPGAATRQLRQRLEEAEILNAMKFTTHAFSAS